VDGVKFGVRDVQWLVLSLELEMYSRRFEINKMYGAASLNDVNRSCLSCLSDVKPESSPLDLEKEKLN